MTNQEKLEKYAWVLLIVIIVILIAVGVTLKLPYYNELNEKCSELAKAQKADDYYSDFFMEKCGLYFCDHKTIGNITYTKNCVTEYWEVKK